MRFVVNTPLQGVIKFLEGKPTFSRPGTRYLKAKLEISKTTFSRNSFKGSDLPANQVWQRKNDLSPHTLATANISKGVNNYPFDSQNDVFPQRPSLHPRYSAGRKTTFSRNGSPIPNQA